MSENSFEMQPIAYIQSDFRDKFGIPRQSGLVESLTSRIVFEKFCRNPQALNGIENFDYLWLLWKFSENHHENWKPTVRPPRLGGNERVGVFATRSPYRPNPIGLSSVKLLGIDWESKDAPALIVAGADLLDGTPIYDIKPYLPYVDSHPDARGGFAEEKKDYFLEVKISEELLENFPSNKKESLFGVLSQDPRPAYQDDAQRIYGLDFAGFNIKFTVENKVLTVKSIQKIL